MNPSGFITKETWDNALVSLLEGFAVYAPLAYNGNQDYSLVRPEDIDQIVYNTPKPTTPLKSFFLPVKENVVKEIAGFPRRIILGIPSCDLAALDMLDAMYLEEPYIDPYYRQKRENTILIGTDCHSLLDQCHCNVYGIQPYPYKNHDISVSIQDDKVYLAINSEKGKGLVNDFIAEGGLQECSDGDVKEIMQVRNRIKDSLIELNKRIPDTSMTSSFIRNSQKDIWQKYSASCVACGACATICPTCTCFLLVDRPEFEKVRQMDTCQYPAFERVAAGEDPLKESYIRFRNRYLCKYVWKPDRFESTACTGCGRCIEACIGGINKNELFLDLYQVLV
jgi:ferredoxin